MARPPKGKPLTLRPIRLDDDVWAQCQRLGKEHGTINEGVAAAQAALRAQEGAPASLIERISRYREVTRPFKAPLLKPSEKGSAQKKG